jgi:hypothetical protein
MNKPPQAVGDKLQEGLCSGLRFEAYSVERVACSE